MPPAECVEFRSRVIEWFRAVTDRIGTAIEDRNRTLAGAPPVIAAVGAMGHVLTNIVSASERTTKITDMAERLTLID